MGNPPPTTPVTPIGDYRRKQSLAETFAAAPDISRLRIFAYGSLMWSPCFEFIGRSRGTLHGYHRGFSIWSVHARGSPENPGLGFALQEMSDARCDGMVFSLPKNVSQQDLIPLWEREMWTETYTPTWVWVNVEGVKVQALTFVVSTDHMQYAGNLPLEIKASYIARASGKYGTCYDYLSETVKVMRDYGVRDPEMENLLAAVDELIC